MRTRCCSLLIVALVLVACGSEPADPDAGSATSTTVPATTVSTATESTTTAAAGDSDPGSDGGLGESVGVTDDVTITVLDDEG
ncbi:MAG: hypothetical protein OSA99_10190 [Acidimicrobiales bacterium]|nr:hypothetical protein [Acidimicrobiales bacterium]